MTTLAATLTSVQETVNSAIYRIEAELARLDGALLGENFVIRVSSQLYVRYQNDQLSVGSVSDSSRFTKAHAYRACLNDNIQDAAGNVGRPVSLRVALAEELVGLRALAVSLSL